MPNYWIDLFTGTTWEEFMNNGATISGFRESRWKTVQRIKPGDILICYLTGISRFIGCLKVLSEPFKDDSKIWADDTFPCRFKVEIIEQLTPKTAIPVHEFKGKLSFYNEHDVSWTGHFRGSPTLWKKEDGDLILAAIREAKKNPIEREYDIKKFIKRPRGIKSNIGSVIIPEDDEDETGEIIDKEIIKYKTDHTEIQYLLLKLGSDMGFDLWVARNDRNKQFNNEKFIDFPKLKKELPPQFDAATNRTIELIDVIWLKGNAIISAFEIESTTSIYSGLLRMSDLITMQPNINIPLYIVAPDDRRDKVIKEINRPSFSKLNPPLYEICRFISFDTLKREILRTKTLIKYLKPEYLDEISESCEIEEE